MRQKFSLVLVSRFRSTFYQGQPSRVMMPPRYAPLSPTLSIRSRCTIRSFAPQSNLTLELGAGTQDQSEPRAEKLRFFLRTYRAQKSRCVMTTSASPPPGVRRRTVSSHGLQLDLYSTLDYVDSLSRVGFGPYRAGRQLINMPDGEGWRRMC